jgi:single-strand DNA-binding protein
MYINKAIIYGNLTRDPELKALPSGSHVASFSVATNRTYKDANGNKQESTDFHNIVVFGRQAETAAQYLKKGAGVFIEGRLQTRSWEKDGQKQYRTEIVADRVQFGPRSSGAQKQDATAPVPPAQRTPPPEWPSEDEINPDDIPF